MTDALHGLTRGCPSLQTAHAKISHHAGSHLTIWTLSKHLGNCIWSSCCSRPSLCKRPPAGLKGSTPVL